MKNVFLEWCVRHPSFWRLRITSVAQRRSLTETFLHTSSSRSSCTFQRFVFILTRCSHEEEEAPNKLIGLDFTIHTSVGVMGRTSADPRVTDRRMAGPSQQEPLARHLVQSWTVFWSWRWFVTSSSRVESAPVCLTETRERDHIRLFTCNTCSR